MDNQGTKDLVFNQLDMIYKSVENTAKQFEVSAVPINLIEMTVTKGKINLTSKQRRKSSEQEITFYTEYNKLLDELIKQCNNDALEMGTTKIPLSLFESHIDVIKSAFEGAITKGVGE